MPAHCARCSCCKLLLLLALSSLVSAAAAAGPSEHLLSTSARSAGQQGAASAPTKEAQAWSAMPLLLSAQPRACVLFVLGHAAVSVLQDRSSSCMQAQPAGMAAANRAKLLGVRHSCNLRTQDTRKGHQRCAGPSRVISCLLLQHSMETELLAAGRPFKLPQ
jgi:hypothetical protein